jgi:hypothetical protein
MRRAFVEIQKSGGYIILDLASIGYVESKTSPKKQKSRQLTSADSIDDYKAIQAPQSFLSSRLK